VSYKPRAISSSLNLIPSSLSSPTSTSPHHVSPSALRRGALVRTQPHTREQWIWRTSWRRTCRVSMQMWTGRRVLAEGSGVGATQPDSRGHFTSCRSRRLFVLSLRLPGRSDLRPSEMRGRKCELGERNLAVSLSSFNTRLQLTSDSQNRPASH
jgi:hypothetical protein